MNTYNNLTSIIKQKGTCVCLSLDTESFAKGQQILAVCAPYICMVKLHPELFSDWDSQTHPQIITEWKREYNILVMLDAKLVDVPEISYKMLKNPYYKSVTWADMVTVMSVNYIGITDYLRSQGISIATIPVTEMNTGSPLFAMSEYQKFVTNSVLSYPGIIGIINQKTYLSYQTEITVKETFLKMTPGVVVYDSEITDNTHESRDMGVHDNMTHLRYRTIKDAMFRDGNDIVIIGGSLIREQVNLREKAKDSAYESMQYSKFYY
jgi:orotidine-5'-phosphate decarboxylase